MCWGSGGNFDSGGDVGVDLELLHGEGGIGEVRGDWMKGCGICGSSAEGGDDVELG